MKNLILHKFTAVSKELRFKLLTNSQNQKLQKQSPLQQFPALGKQYQISTH